MNPNPSRPVRVLAVSDHPLTAWSLQRFVESLAPRAESSGAATSAVEARRELGERPVDIIVVDLDGTIGIDAIADLATASPARVIALTASSELSLHDGAILAGAGFVGLALALTLGALRSVVAPAADVVTVVEPVAWEEEVVEVAPVAPVAPVAEPVVETTVTDTVASDALRSDTPRA